MDRAEAIDRLEHSIEEQIGQLDAENALKKRLTTFDLGEISRPPEPREVICGYFPIHSTTTVTAGGGTGKTTWLVRKALDYANDEGGETLFVSAEDGAADYQAKIHNALFSRSAWNQPYQEVASEKVEGKLHILDLKGMGSKLVVDLSGSLVPGILASQLSDLILEMYPRVRVVVFETVSRFAGGEDNERMEALVSACDHIALAINGACVVVHHTGKSQARDKVVDLYSGRGGSALGDNTRSMIVLTKLGDDYPGELPTLADREDIEKGRVFEVNHVRNSYGMTKAPEYFATRPGYCHGPVLEGLAIATKEDRLKAQMAARDARLNAAATTICKIIRESGGSIRKKYFDINTKELLGLSQREGRELIEELLELGTLVEDQVASGRARQKVLREGGSY